MTVMMEVMVVLTVTVMVNVVLSLYMVVSGYNKDIDCDSFQKIQSKK